MKEKKLIRVGEHELLEGALTPVARVDDPTLLLNQHLSAVMVVAWQPLLKPFLLVLREEPRKHLL